MKKNVVVMLLAACALFGAAPLAAQDFGPFPGAPPGFPGGPGGPGGRGPGRFPPAYPARVTDPASVERGKSLYTDNKCAACHAADTRGSAQGPSLLRSQLVQRDQKGELIAPVIRAGANGMPALPNLSDRQIADIAEFLHSFTIDSRDPARQRPDSIVTGNAASGQAYFEANCSGCHAVTGDLKGLAAKYADPRTLQGRFLAPVATRPITVTVTSGKVDVQGRLNRIDEFFVSLTKADGTPVTFARHGNVPKVDVQDPLAAHKALLRKYSDQNIHDVTAYLVTLK